ncbi:MAG: hypothetical protein WCI87_08145 [Euryarchaeota archaeon]
MVAPQEEGKGQEPTQPEGETGKVPKKGMGAGKKWLIFFGIGCVIALVVVGIGFIPKTRNVASTCQTTEYYDCYLTEYSDCYVTEEYDCQEAYTCYEPEPYTYTETVDLTYTKFDTYAEEAFWDCDKTIYTTIRNTDSVGGYFDVDFSCYVGGTHMTASQTLWISAGNTQVFSQHFSHGCSQSWSWSTPTVDPPTKSVQQVGTHSVAHTCYRDDTCERDVWTTDGCSESVWTTDGCSQQVDSTCNVQVQDRLFW